MENTHRYKITYIMPCWYEVVFTAPPNLSEEEAWKFMVDNKEYMNGDECEWSRVDDGFWDDAITDSEAEVIRNITTDETLYQMP